MFLFISFCFHYFPCLVFWFLHVEDGIIHFYVFGLGSGKSKISLKFVKIPPWKSLNLNFKKLCEPWCGHWAIDITDASTVSGLEFITASASVLAVKLEITHKPAKTPTNYPIHPQISKTTHKLSINQPNHPQTSRKVTKLPTNQP